MADRAERLEHGREYEVEEDVSGARQAKFPGADQRDWTENDLHHRFTEKLAGLSDKALDAQERRHDITQYTREDRLEVQEARTGAINAMAFATPEEKAELAFHVTDSVFTPVFERTELAEAHSQWVETDNQQPHRDMADYHKDIFRNLERLHMDYYETLNSQTSFPPREGYTQLNKDVAGKLDEFLEKAVEMDTSDIRIREIRDRYREEQHAPA